jgi:TonB family protein
MRNTAADLNKGKNALRSYVASAALAAAFVLLPAATGYAPASAQDFSITNETGRGSEWYKQLQAWWDLHAYYPPDASAKNESGDVKVHLTIKPDGEVWKVEVVQGSGLKVFDMAGYEVFKYALLRPIPPDPAVPQADVYITEHYVLTHRSE